MKYFIRPLSRLKISYLKIVVLLCLVQFMASCANKQVHTLTLTNALSLARPDEPIIISRQKLTELLGDIPSGMYPELTNSNGKPVPSQTDDMDHDGTWDELAFVCNFQPDEEVKLNCHYVDKLPVYPLRTSVRFAKQDGKGGYMPIDTETMPADHTVEHTLQRYQLEGPGWENDKIAFRNYFDRRNAIDIFGKKSTQMVLDKTDLDEKVAEYMHMQPWGMDIFTVKNSLGAGGLGVFVKDSLYRLSGAKTTRYELVTKGPVRSVIRLTYLNFTAGGQTFNVKHEISIWAGEPGYQSKVWLSGFSGERVLVSGIAHIKNKTLDVVNHNSDFMSLSTHDKQADSGDYLGTALLIKKSDFIGAGEAPEVGEGVTQTYYAKLKAKNNEPVSFYFIAGWQQQDAGYASADYFKNTLQQQAAKLSNPIIIAKQ